MGRVLFWQIAGIVLFWAVLVALRLDQPIDVTNPEVRLGDHTYVKSDLNAPILSGALLSVFEYVATRSVFGGVIRRFLLNDNKIRHLRELGAQMPADVLPLSHPLRRLNKAEREEYDAGVQQAVAKHTDLDSIVPFVVSDTVRQSLALQNSEVLRLHDAFLAGTTTPTAVTGKVLSEIDRLQPVYKMFASEPLSDEILAAAAASTQRYASGAPLSIFDGVPVAFKDMINIAGYVMTDGSAFKRKFNPVSNKDDLIVKRFRDIGAIIMPPTSMVEGGVSPVGFCVEVQGPFNPHKASHYSGGSSGGSAVAVALGIVPVAIGYDGGGSIRTPASLSGVVGFATGYGRLPFESHITGTNIKGGPFTRTVADAALAYAVMARPVPEGYRGFFDEMYDGNFNGVPKAILNQFLQPAPKGPGGETRDLVGVKLGVMREWFDDCDSSVREVAWAGFAQLVARGATVVDVSIPNLSQGRLAHAFTIASEFAFDWDPVVGHPGVGSLVEPNTRVTVALGHTVTAVEVKSAERMRAWLFGYLRDEIFSKVDAIVTPTTPISAPVIRDGSRVNGESNSARDVELLKYVYVANFLGLPSVSVPVGHDGSNDDMPVGLMMTAAWWQEDLLFRIAQAAQSASAEHVHAPADAIQL